MDSHSFRNEGMIWVVYNWRQSSVIIQKQRYPLSLCKICYFLKGCNCRWKIELQDQKRKLNNRSDNWSDIWWIPTPNFIRKFNLELVEMTIKISTTENDHKCQIFITPTSRLNSSTKFSGNDLLIKQFISINFHKKGVHLFTTPNGHPSLFVEERESFFRT